MAARMRYQLPERAAQMFASLQDSLIFALSSAFYLSLPSSTHRSAQPYRPLLQPSDSHYTCARDTRQPSGVTARLRLR